LHKEKIITWQILCQALCWIYP